MGLTSGVAAIDVGERHTCAVLTPGAGLGVVCAIDSSGTVYCWSPNSSLPAVLTLPGSAVALALSFVHSCAAFAEGSVWCWGSNDD